MRGKPPVRPMMLRMRAAPLGAPASGLSHKRQRPPDLRPEALEVAGSAQSRNRTSDTGIFSPLLYQLSYLGVWVAARNSALIASHPSPVNIHFDGPLALLSGRQGHRLAVPGRE